MILEVYRGDGLRPGQPIVEPLLSDDALIHRGRAEMEAHAEPVDAVDITILPRPGLRLGQRVSYLDAASGRLVDARITGIELHADGDTLLTRLSLEKPR